MGIDRQGAESAPAEDPVATIPLLERLERRAERRAGLAVLEADEVALAEMAEALTPAPDDEAALEDYVPSDELALALRIVSNAAEETAAAGFIRVQLKDFHFGTALSDLGEALPDELQPGARLPEPNASPDAPASQIAGPMAWSAIFAPEAKLTSDRRAFAPGSITWRELPLTLMAMIETSEGGHIGAEVSGRIDEIWRDDVTGLIRGRGVFDDGEFGQKIADLVADQTLRGVSVDLAISKYETGPRSDWFDDEGNWAPKETADDETPSLLDLYSDDTIAVVLAAEIGMVTVCPFPAFAEAKIAMGDSLVAGANPAFWTVTQQAGWTVERCETCADEALVASGGWRGVITDLQGNELGEIPLGLTASAAGLVPEEPPASWFADPQLEEPTPLTVTDEGQVFGHAAVWGVCHMGMPGTCRTAPHSSTDYALFHLGEILCSGGERVACGQITLDTGHADRVLRAADATAHYDQTGLVAAHVAVGEDEHGIWVAGALQPDAPADKVRLLRGAKLSGDWRKVDGNFELVALLAVNVPGFPVPRSRALVASIEGEDPEPISLVAAGIPVFVDELAEEEREAFAELQAEWIRAELEAA